MVGAKQSQDELEIPSHWLRNTPICLAGTSETIVPNIRKLIEITWRIASEVSSVQAVYPKDQIVSHTVNASLNVVIETLLRRA